MLVIFCYVFLSLVQRVLSISQQLALQQPHIEPPRNSLFRELVWGDLNFIHTTDTHGWLAGHLNQKQYSADWGDFVSFTSHLHSIADRTDKDILLIDTGDKHDGNGLSDASNPNGEVSTPIFNKQEYDLLTIGNHELYTDTYSTQEFETTVQKFGERYVSSNVEYKLDNGTWVPFGNKFRYFTTKNRGLKVLSLSFLFNFSRFNPKTRVFPIRTAIKQDWFRNLTATYKEEDLDFLVVFGHIPVTDLEEEEILQLHIALRRIYPNTIIHYFGGHSHIRDYAIYDYKAAGLQSGRYCETLGWASVNITEPNAPLFSRRYIDFNKESLIHHSKSTKHEFDTKKGLSITKEITDARENLNLTFSFGSVPRNYPLNEHPYGHPSNLYTFVNSSILPNLENEIGRDTSSFNRIILINSGSIRYDLFKGNFSKDTEYTISPFPNEWNYIKLPKILALKLEHYLNQQEFFLNTELSSPENRGIINRINKRVQLQQMMPNDMEPSTILSCPFIKKPYLKRGQTTHDDAGCDGDDTFHNSVNYYPSPNVVQTYQEFDSKSDEVDTVFYSFIEPYILSAINTLNERHKFVSKKFTKSDVNFYGGKSTGTLLRTFIETHWS